MELPRSAKSVTKVQGGGHSILAEFPHSAAAVLAELLRSAREAILAELPRSSGDYVSFCCVMLLFIPV